MITEPKVVDKPAQPFAAIVLTVAQPEISQKAPPLIADVIAWCNANGIRTNGPPFFNYTTFLPGGRMEMQVGMPTATVGNSDAKITTGELPAGKYASVTHTGPYHELYEANMALDKWGRDQGLEFAGVDRGERFDGATRLEIYHRDPDEKDGTPPTTEVAFKLKD